MVLHWDRKVIKYAAKKTKDDRLAIIGGFPGVTENAVKKTDQFFGAPLIANNNGRLCALTLVDVLAEWKIPESIIIGTCWDTTATNTGHESGSAVLFETRLMHAILWIACRHHMGELHVKHPDIKIRVIVTTSPDDVMFKKFQNIYESLPPCSVYRLYQWPDVLVHPMDFRTTVAVETLRWAEEAMREGSFSKQRDDYRELCELVAIYLGDK